MGEAEKKDQNRAMAKTRADEETRCNNKEPTRLQRGEDCLTSRAMGHSREQSRAGKTTSHPLNYMEGEQADDKKRLQNKVGKTRQDALAQFGPCKWPD